MGYNRAKFEMKFEMKKILFTSLGLFFSTVMFAQQSKELVQIYNQLDSLENRILELQRQNDENILSCVKYGKYNNYNDGCAKSIVYKDNRYNNNNYSSICDKNAQEICECMVGKKHEIDAVKTQIKQIERRIDLIKNENKPVQNVKK